MEYFSNLKAKLIYVFRIPDAAHKDCLKIGEATFEDGDITLQPNSHPLNKAAKARIDQYTKTAGIHYELLHTEIAIFIRDGKLCGMNDKEVHEVLLRSGIKRKEFAEFLLGDYTTFKVVVKNADVIENGTNDGTNKNDFGTNEDTMRKDAVVEMMRRNKRVSVKQISESLNILRRTMFRIIDALKSENRINRVGDLKSGTWEVIE